MRITDDGWIGRVRCRCAMLAAVLAVAITALPSFAADRERWYMLLLDGQHAGWMHETTDTADRLITTTGTMHLRLKRGATELLVEMGTEFQETPEGEPVLMRSRTVTGATPMMFEYRFGDDAVEVVTSNVEGREVITTQPLPDGVWLTPMAADRYVRERLAAGATEITVRTMDPTTGLSPITVTYRDIRPAMAEYQGRSIKGFSCLSETSASPGFVTEQLMAEDGALIRSTTGFGPMTIVLLAAEKDVALAKAEAPEMMIRTFVKPDRPIRQPREVRSATYVLEVPADAAIDVPTVGAQQARVLEPGKVEVVVDLDDLQSVAEFVDRDRLLAPTAMLRCDDEAVASIATKAVGRVKDGDDAARAEALRRAVYRHIRKKNLGVGFASASEVARTREGDCSEHAVLLAALLRAEGIPSQVAAGVVYADEFEGEKGIFGYHMWTQALLNIDGRNVWIDLDATFPNNVPFDATHIVLGTSALGDDEPIGALASMAPLLGRLGIVVKNVEHQAHAESTR